MSSLWTEFLASHPSAAHTLEPAAELQRLRDTCVLHGMGAEGLIEAVGPDAEAFLHAQLSSDVKALEPHRCQLSTYNSPKGRVLATLLLWRTAEGFLLQTSGSVARSVCQRLSMFVLRSKLRLGTAEQGWARIAVAGGSAAQALHAAGLAVPERDFDLATGAESGHASHWLLKLPRERYTIVAPAEVAIALWQALVAQGARVGTGAAWRWLSVRSGIAQVTAATQDELVPQMLNYDVLGAVSFSKGCYPGQEIVARTQYRGEIKRRTLLLHARTSDAPAPGHSVHAADAQQPVGSVLCAAAAPVGGCDLLACLHLDLARGAELRLGNAEGAVLEPLELPYALPAGR